eukprot:SAG22_NODE_1945_length_3279_cov_1.768239_3_plen_78_part_00
MSCPLALSHTHSLARSLARTGEAIWAGKKPLIDGVEGRRSVELILAIYEASQSGQPVQLPLTEDPPSVRLRHAAAES